MKIAVEVHGLKILGSSDSRSEFEMVLDKGADRNALLTRLGLDPGAGILVVVNGRVASREHVFSHLDQVSLFAPVIGG